MTPTRGVYGNFSVDYIVIRGGKQELYAYGLFMNADVVDKDFTYDVVLDMDSTCRGGYVTPLEKELLITKYTRYITDRLEHLQSPHKRKQCRVLFVSSSYIPRPLLGITGARPEMISCFLNCFSTVYVVDGDSLCNQRFVEKWSVDNSLPEHLRVAHYSLDSYTPVNVSEMQRMGVWSGKQKEDITLDEYHVYKEGHIIYIKRSSPCMKLRLRWSLDGLQRKPNTEYMIKQCGLITFVWEYQSLQNEFILNKLKALLAHIVRSDSV